MEYTFNTSGKEAIVTMTGSLSASDQSEYKTLLNKCKDSGASTYRIDLAGVPSIDSTGLGLLLMLQDSAKSANATVTLENPQEGPKSAFELAHFDELFTIS